MPGTKGPKTHDQARLHCCAACGRGGGVKHSVTPAIEQLIRKYVHPAYNVNVESFHWVAVSLANALCLSVRKQKKLIRIWTH